MTLIIYSRSFMWQGDDGNWWVKYSDINVGYYPAEIFNNFTNPGIVGEGGATVAPNPPAGICPPLGSGIFPDGKYEHSCSIRLVQYSWLSKKKDWFSI